MELSAAAAAAANDEDSSHLFVRTVSRILHRVDCTEGHEEGTAMTTDATTVAAAVASDDSGGPLSRSELNELSLLCCRSGSTAGASAAASTATAAAAAVIHGEEEHQGSFFAAVEGDQLVGLVELLHRHINRAVSIHFVEAAAAAVILGQQQSQTSSSSSSTTMEQVRVCLSACVCLNDCLFVIPPSQSGSRNSSSHSWSLVVRSSFLFTVVDYGGRTRHACYSEMRIGSGGHSFMRSYYTGH